jgi:hypothetical protein
VRAAAKERLRVLFPKPQPGRKVSGAVAFSAAGRRLFTEGHELLAAPMKDNPPAREDAPMVQKMARIGIVPGKDFDVAGCPRRWP